MLSGNQLVFRSRIAVALVIWILSLPAAREACAAETAFTLTSIDSGPSSWVSALVMKEAYAAIGIHIVIRLASPPVALQAADSGRVDATLHRIESAGRQWRNLLRVPVAINSVEPMVVTRHHDVHVDGWKSLGSFRLGVVRGLILYEQRTAGMDVVRLPRLQQLLAMLQRDRLDAVVGNRLDLLGELRQPEFSGLRANTTVLESVPLYHYVHRRHAALVPRLQATLRRMQRNGRMEAIRQEVISRLEHGQPLPDFPVPLQAEDASRSAADCGLPPAPVPCHSAHCSRLAHAG